VGELVPRAAALAAVLAALAAGCAQVRTCRDPLPFGPAMSLATGQLPLDVATGDLDGNGAIDLVTADARQGSLSVWLNRGAGVFEAAPARPGPVNAHLVAIADLDRDGDLDLVATDHDTAGVGVWLGDGRGAFTAAPGSPFMAHGGTPHNHGLAAIDVSSDGVPDVITFNQEDRSVSVLLGDGAGGFAPASGSPLDVGADPYVGRAADVDGDGKVDLVAPLIGGAAVALLRGDGQGGFVQAPGSPYATLDRPYAALVSDLNGDSRPDVVLAHDDTDRITVLLGEAGGRLTPAEGSPFALGARVFGMAAADINGDGTLEILAGAGDRILMLFQDRAARGWGFCRGPDLTAAQSWTVTTADLDGDGRPDVIAPDAITHQLKIWLSSKR
jgi:hypothetical protein